MRQFTAYIERDPESGAHTEADTLDELQVRLQDVPELCLEELDA